MTEKKKTPAQAAADEAVAGVQDVTVEFRGEKFLITAERRLSWKFTMAVASNNPAQMIAEAIDAKDRPRMLAVGKDDERFWDVANEFWNAYAEASGQGNS